MYEKTMECADMIMAPHGPLWQNTFARCNLVLGQKETYVFFYLIAQNILSHSLFHTLTHTHTHTHTQSTNSIQAQLTHAPPMAAHFLY